MNAWRMPDRTMTVTALNQYIRGLMTSDSLLSDVWVTGEISNFKHHTSGHMYFTLKDDKSSIRTVMFRQDNARVRFTPLDGLKIVARGYVSVYERDGQYQLYVQDLQPEGLGALYLAFEQLKKKLSEEGLFLPVHKKPLPLLPRAVGVITSPTGAVIRDIIRVSLRRYPNARIRLFPAMVQGPDASEQLARALDVLNRIGGVEVIILGRGGGSLEDLQAFNSEVLARAIFRSAIPVVSAVGHETDETIADYVADLRASTPSAAAEVVYPEKQGLITRLLEQIARLRKAEIHLLEQARVRLDHLAGSPVFRQPLRRADQERERLDHLQHRLTASGENLLKGARTRFDTLAGQLQAVSPLAVLSRGFGLVTDRETGKTIRSVRDAVPGQEVMIRLTDGRLLAMIHEAMKDIP